MAADYYPLLSRAVRALEQDTEEARAAIYNRARRLVHGHLNRNRTSNEDVAAEKSALEDAIWRIEFELAPDRARGNAPREAVGVDHLGATAPFARRYRIGGRSIVLAFLLGCMVFITGGFLLAQERANQIANQNIRTAIFESEFGRFLRVGEIKAGLFDQTIVLKRVEFRFPEQQFEPIKAKEVLISDFNKFADTAIKMRITITDFEIPLASSGFPALLRDAGYTLLVGSTSFSYDYDVNLRTLLARFSYDFPDIQHGEIYFAFDDFDIRTFSAIAGTIRSISPFETILSQAIKLAPIWSGLVDTLVQLKISDARYSICDLGLGNRLWTALSKRENWDGSVSDYSEQTLRPLHAQLAAEFEKQGYNTELASEMSEKTINFIKYGGEIRFSTKISRPFALFMRDGVGIVPRPRKPQEILELSAPEYRWAPRCSG